MDSKLAQDACGAYVTARGGSESTDCQPFASSADASAPDNWCAATCTGTTCTGFLNDCICWFFTGSAAGTVLDPQAASISNPQNCYYGTSTGTFN
jgi:hypothetical protein